MQYFFTTYVLWNMKCITASNFTNKGALIGAIYTSISLFSISGSNFVNNSAWYGGVIYAYNSSFSIGFTIFIGNRVNMSSGVLYATTGSSFNTTS